MAMVTERRSTIDLDSLGSFISPKYLAPEEMSLICEKFRSTPNSAMMLDGFLTRPFRSLCEEAIASAAQWQPRYHVFTGPTTTAEVDEAAWALAPKDSRFSCAEYLPMREALAQPGALLPIVRFALTGPVLRTWLSACFARDVRLNTCEMVRYRKGGFLAAHSDSIDGRLFGCNLYLDPAVTADSGGLLGFRGKGEAWNFLTPTSGALSLIPIADAEEHQVSPWLRSAPGRYTLAMSFRPAN